MAGILYLVGTPIGNLNDMSPRALETLKTVDFIAAEDTRVTLKLLNHFSIRKPLLSYYEHNKVESAALIIPRLLNGESCALVSDAGMPAISDPGEDIVAMCHARGIPVGVVPGPTAMATALAVSGLPTARFTFEGFLSVNKKERRAHLASIAGEERTMVFYEAPHKLLATLTALHATLGDRPVALVRELTKIHEEVARTTLSEAIARYTADAPRGEFVLVVGGAPAEERQALTPEEAARIAERYVAQGMSASEAAKRAAAESGCKKGDIYRLLIQE